MLDLRGGRSARSSTPSRNQAQAMTTSRSFLEEKASANLTNPSLRLKLIRTGRRPRKSLKEDSDSDDFVFDAADDAVLRRSQRLGGNESSTVR